MAYIKAYTRQVVDKRTYPTALAGSVHLAVSFNGDDFLPLNNNYGILFPKAEIGKLNNILERNIKNPRIAAVGEKYLIFADCIDPDGNELTEDSAVLWETLDFIDFCEMGIVKSSDYAEALASATDTIPVKTSMLEPIIDKYTPVHFVRAEIPESVTAADTSELDNIKAVCRYSDGSEDIKPIKWDTDAISGAGTFKVRGEIIQKKYPVPCIHGFADPVIYKRENKWYFIATNDTTGNIGLYASCAETIDGLFAEDNKPRCILPYDEEKGFMGTFWAPEFHQIGDDLYILFAVGGKVWAPQSHMMKLKRGGDILSPDDWYTPVRVTKKDGTPLGVGEITLDMTYFAAGGRHYVAWSQRCFSPADSGSMIYIGEISPDDPCRLISDPVLIARPLYGWENQNGTVNNEGPYALFANDKIYLAYSGGSAGGYSYSLGYLIADIDAELLSPDSWRKTITPVLTSFDTADREGAGHNAFYYDGDGKIMITYHAQKPGQDGMRNTYIHRVHISKNGFPILNLIPERDLPDDKRFVSLTVHIREQQ